MSRQTLVAIRYSQARYWPGPPKPSRPRQARRNVSCTASSASSNEVPVPADFLEQPQVAVGIGELGERHVVRAFRVRARCHRAVGDVPHLADLDAASGQLETRLVHRELFRPVHVGNRDEHQLKSVVHVRDLLRSCNERRRLGSSVMR
jgi:hypothetical protein